MIQKFICVYVCVLDSGAVWAEGECARRSAQSTTPQPGLQPERPFSAALLRFTESAGVQGVSTCGVCGLIAD